MKKTLILLAAITFGLLASAQTQKGYVKTKGRMVNGKHVSGKGLPGATVSIKGGNSVIVKNNDGSFSFPVPAQSFQVQSVQKNGYQLVNTDAFTDPLQYSPNPIYLLMETPEQQSQDLLEAERKIRRTLQQQLQQREDELESLKETHKITVEEYQQAMKKLYDDQKDNDKLIAEMAKQYTLMDYDQMDELNQRISDAILNGRLTEADSLLRSKGDIHQRMAEIRRAQQAEAQREEEIAQELANLEASRIGTQKKLNDVAEDCFQYFNLCKLNHQFDSAAYYITLRADLDSTNYHWVLAAADYLTKQRRYQRAILYYNKAIPSLRNKNHLSGLAVVYECLGGLHYTSNRVEEGILVLLEALEIASQIEEGAEDRIAHILTNLGVIYNETLQYDKCEDVYLKALEIYRKLAKSYPVEYESDLANTLSKLGSFYVKTKRYEEAEQMLYEALKIVNESRETNHEYDVQVAGIFENLGGLFRHTNRLDQSEHFYLQALEKYRILVKENPQAYEFGLHDVLDDLGHLYYRDKRFAESETAFLEALEVARKLVLEEPANDIRLATTLLQYANMLYISNRMEESEKVLTEAVEIYRRLAKTEQAYHEKFAVSLKLMSLLYIDQGKYLDAQHCLEEVVTYYDSIYDSNPERYLKHFQKVLSQVPQAFPTEDHANKYSVYEKWLPLVNELYQKYPELWEDHYVTALGELSYHCIFLKKFTEAEELAREALSKDPMKLFVYTNLAPALLFQGKFGEAKAIYIQYMDAKKEAFLQDLNDFEAAGIIPEKSKTDVEKIRKLLSK